MKDLTLECQNDPSIKKNNKISEVIRKYFGNAEEKIAQQMESTPKKDDEKSKI